MFVFVDGGEADSNAGPFLEAELRLAVAGKGEIADCGSCSLGCWQGAQEGQVFGV
ncbi:MAG: hypothetical protein V2A73_02620 [Pseudomonadota bacterium]